MAARGAFWYVRAMMRGRHLVRLSGEFVAYAWVNGTWWLLPLVLVVAIATLLITAGQVVAPFTLYTVF